MIHKYKKKIKIKKFKLILTKIHPSRFAKS
jgi:hypothetical protein